MPNGRPSWPKPAVMVALEATLVLRSAGADRRLPAEQFFTGLFATALEPGELLTAIELPALPARSGSAFEELSRRHGDYALVGVAAMLTLDEAGRCARARITLSVGEGPTLAVRAAAALAGEALDPESIGAAAELAATEDIDPPSDIHASAAYRRQLARVLTRRALTRAAARARASTSIPA